MAHTLLLQRTFPIPARHVRSVPEPLPDGVPDHARYWKLLRKKEIQTEEDVAEKYKKSIGHVVHRMATSHYLYVLERTAVGLEPAEVQPLDRSADEE